MSTRTRQAELNLEKELFSACEAGDVERIRRAIADGVNPKKAINNGLIFPGETPLHVACRYVHALATKFVCTFI